MIWGPSQHDIICTWELGQIYKLFLENCNNFYLNWLRLLQYWQWYENLWLLTTLVGLFYIHLITGARTELVRVSIVTNRTSQYPYSSRNQDVIRNKKGQNLHNCPDWPRSFIRSQLFSLQSLGELQSLTRLETNSVPLQIYQFIFCVIISFIIISLEYRWHFDIKILRPGEIENSADELSF